MLQHLHQLSAILILDNYIVSGHVSVFTTLRSPSFMLRHTVAETIRQEGESCRESCCRPCRAAPRNGTSVPYPRIQ